MTFGTMRVPFAGATALAFVAALSLSGCGNDPPPGVLARVAGQDLTERQFDRYLTASLLEGWDIEDLAPDEIDGINSRLFDSFVEEHILLAEAQRRGIRVEDEELERYLEWGAEEAPEEDPTSPDGADEEGEPRDPEEERLRRVAIVETARRTLRIQKLVAAVVTEELRSESAADPGVSEPDPQEEAPQTDDGDRRILLRSLLLSDAATAKRVHREIRRRRMTFEEAVAAHEPTEGQALPSTVSISELPTVVRNAVAELRVGEVSAPVELHGDTYLFQVQGRLSRADPGPDAEALARRAALEARRREAAAGLVEELRRTTDVKIFAERLPFRYIPG